ncbi:TetR family transcriptional regulator [Photobacterium nomapromontoriensis]|uniref:TetR family transcriptional regulator n=1 Tax=Photobacterium nomapromontoriensis TaxID=2910237 RepID=UPI003D14CFB0
MRLGQMTKREKLIAGFLELAQKEGITLTGVDTIADYTEISKKTIYNNFGSKEGLVLEALTSFSHRIQQAWAKEWDDIADKKDLILARFTELEMLIKSQQFYGCIFMSACREFADEQHPLHQLAVKHKQASYIETQKRLTALGAENTQLALHIELLYEGLIVKLVAHKDLKLIADTKDIVRNLLR